jgi:twinkle protein
MEIGANAFNIISIWCDRKFEEQAQAPRESPDGQEAGIQAVREPSRGVLRRQAAQRRLREEGVWFDQDSYRYRSRADEPSWPGERSESPRGG